MEGTTSRLRKTFHYPADNDDDDSGPEALDEEGKFLLPSNFVQFSLSKHHSLTPFMQSKRI